MAKHSKKSCWIPNSLSRYNGAIYATILRHVSEPSFQKHYEPYLLTMMGYFGSPNDEGSCLAEISAAGYSLKPEVKEKSFEKAIIPISKLFGLDLSRLNDLDIIERGKLILKAIKDVPKRLIAVSILAGMLFAGGENWQNIVEIIQPNLIPEMASIISENNIKTNAEYTLKEAVAEEDMAFKPTLPKKLNGHVVAYMDPIQADMSRNNIIKVLGMANNNLSEKTKSVYADYIITASKKFKLNPALVAGIVIAESTGNVTSVSSAGAKGLMQVMWSVHGKSLNKKFGYNTAKDLHDPVKGLTAGCWIFKGYLERKDNNIRKALSAYLGTSQSGYYYNKIMKWAKLAQPNEYEFKLPKALVQGGFTASEAETALKTTVMLAELGPMNAEDLIETVITFLPNASMERVGEIASIVIKHEKIVDGFVHSKVSNALESEYILNKITPDFDRDLCTVQIQAKLDKSKVTIGDKFASIKRFPMVTEINDKISARD